METRNKCGHLPGRTNNSLLCSFLLNFSGAILLHEPQHPFLNANIYFFAHELIYAELIEGLLCDISCSQRAYSRAGANKNRAHEAFREK